MLYIYIWYTEENVPQHTVSVYLTTKVKTGYIVGQQYELN